MEGVLEKVVLLVLVVNCKSNSDVEFKHMRSRSVWGIDEPPSDSINPNDSALSPDQPPPPPPGIEGGFNHNHEHRDQFPPESFHNHHHRDGEFTTRRTVPNGNRNSVMDNLGSNITTGIPIDFAKSISEYSSISDILLNFVEDEPDSIQPKPFVVSRFGDDDDNGTERNAGQFARPAKCQPELVTVRIAESNAPNVFYVPECTRIERCGGCCSHALLECQPTETETVTFSIVKAEYTFNNNKLKYVGKEPVSVERHTKCKCGCKVKQADCNIYQEYKESECRCTCKNLDEEKKCYKNSLQKLWNPDVCACQCREIEPCTTGLQFDFNECRCVPNQTKRRYILTNFRKEEPENAG